MLEPRYLGDSPVKAVGLGCMNVSHAYGPAQPADDAIRLFQHALDIGYDFFDTATIYGLGATKRCSARRSGIAARSSFWPANASWACATASGCSMVGPST